MTAEQQATHSPPPWKWRTAGKGEAFGLDSASGDVLRTVDAGYDGCVIEVSPENAAVLEAAPDLLAAAEQALEHVLELREAWERGALSEHDGKGGTRSNRNVDVWSALRTAIEKAR